MTELPQSRLASLRQWRLTQPSDPLERIVIIALSNALLVWARHFIPAGAVPGVVTGAMLLNLLLLFQITLRSPVGPLQRTPLELSLVPLSLLLLCGTVALSVPPAFHTVLGNARFQTLPAYTPVTLQLQDGRTVQMEVRAQGLTCLLRGGLLPGGAPVYLRQDRQSVPVALLRVSQEVRATVARVPMSTVHRLSCWSPHAGRVDDLQVVRKNGVLTIDPSMR